MILPNYCSIGKSVCNFCLKEDECREHITSKMRISYPMWHSSQEYSADDPVWKVYKEVIDEISVNCFTFDYDDASISICPKHLLYLAQEVSQ